MRGNKEPIPVPAPSRLKITETELFKAARKQPRVFRLQRVRRFAHTRYWHTIRQYVLGAFYFYLILLFAGVMQVVGQHQTLSRYQLTATENRLLDPVSQVLADKLSFDSQQQTYQFNAGYVPPANTARVGGAQYTASLSTDPHADGISVTDPLSKLTVNLKPEFTTLAGKQQGGRVIYPVNDSVASLVYTLKNNGLKEDILLPSYQGDAMDFSYKLNLPVGLEAHLRPDGGIGIYGGDRSLFGNITTGTANDKALLDKARQKSPKTNLMFVIPAPAVKEANGPPSIKAAFSLKGDELTVRATKLSLGHYPLSIDPSLALANTSDWTQGNNDTNNIDYSVSGQISRAGLTGGSVGSFSTGSNSQTASQFIYNGYAYNISTCFASYEPLGSDGASFFPSTGSQTTNNACFANYGIDSYIIYNGYAYAIGGVDRSPTPCGGTLQPSCTFSADDQVWYSKINSDGSLSAWTQTSTLVKHHQTGPAAAYNGYIYLYDQYNSSNSLTDNGTTQYAKINGDGTLGSWTASTSLSSPPNVASSAAQIYNGYFYLIGGTASSNTAGVANVYYAPISSSGFGAWQSTTSLNTVRAYPHATAYRGYLYVAGGCSTLSGGACDNVSGTLSSVEYAPIYANGSLGSWTTTNALNEAQGRIGSNVGVIGHGNYIYVTGGAYCQGVGGSCNSTVDYTDFQYAKIDQPGVTGSYTSGGSYATARYGNGVALVRGYLFTMGGCISNGGGYGCGSLNETASVEAAPITSTGAIGTFTAKASLPAARSTFGVAVYGDYIYLTGGCTGAVCTLNNDTLIGHVTDTSGTVSWTDDTTHTFTNVRREQASTAYNGYLYIAGGWFQTTNPSLYADIQKAPINAADGSIGAWSSAGTMPAAANRFSVVAYQGYFYEMYATDYYAPIDSSTGNVGSFTTATNSTGVYDGTAYADKGYMYVNQGSNVLAAVINSDGSFGTWNNLVSSPATYHGGGGIIVNGGNVYLMSGCINWTSSGPTCNTAGTSTQYASLNNGGGSTGSWTSTTSGGTLTARQSAQTVLLNGYLYTMGGCTIGNCTTITGGVQYAPLNSDGSVGTWSTPSVGSSITARQNFAAFAYNGYLYVAGGCTNGACNTYTQTIQYVKPAANGDITSSWTTNSVNLPASDIVFQITPYNGYAYRVGGNVNASYASSVEYAPIDASTGALGSWTSTSSLNEGLRANSLITYNGYIYSVGGQLSSGSPQETDHVEYAPINANGTLGTWRYANAMGQCRSTPTLAVVDGLMYATGGYCSGPSHLNSAEYAPILPNGELGGWAFSGQTLNTGRVSGASGTSTYYNGYLYIVGGQDNSSNELGSVEYARASVIPRLAHYSRLFTTDKDTMPANFFTTGNLQGNNTAYSVTYMTATSGSPTSWSALSATACTMTTKYPVSITGDGVSYYWVLLTIDDSLSAVYGETSGSTLNDFQLNYHPNPSMRLRGGSTFNGTLLQSLDAP